MRFIDLQLLLVPVLRGPAAVAYGRALDAILAEESHFPGRTFVAVDHPLSSDRLGMDFLGGFSSAELDFRRRSLRLTQ